MLSQEKEHLELGEAEVRSCLEEEVGAQLCLGVKEEH